MAHQGGKRTGAGRPKGALNKKTLEQIEKVEAEGITPLQYMLEVLRDETRDPAERMDAAHKAAPYIHPKLTAIDHTSDGEKMASPTAIERLVVQSGD